jgi:hypothetical protein
MIKLIHWFKSLVIRPTTKFQLCGANVKCLNPDCNVWSHDVNGVQDMKYVDDIILITTCKKCGEESEWFSGAPVLIPMEEIKQNNKRY